MIDAISLLPGRAGSQADAVSAYTQAKLYGDGRVTKIDTWVELPREQWPSAWVGTRKRPVVPLRLALYGHPLSGYFWEQHCSKSLLEVGFEPLEGWECIYVHKELKLFLSVYVDDFKLAGLAKNLKKGWSLIQSKLRLDAPTELGDYLGCGQKPICVSEDVIRESLQDVLPLISDDYKGPEASDSESEDSGNPRSWSEGTAERESLYRYDDSRSSQSRFTRPPSSARGGSSFPSSSRKSSKSSDDSRESCKVRGVRYDMLGFTDECIKKYCDAAGKSIQQLRKAETPGMEDSAFTQADFDEVGKLSSVAASVLMKALYLARCCRFDLLHPICMLARQVTKWSRACDKRLHKLIAYLHTTREHSLEGFIGDDFRDLTVLFF